MKETRTRYAPSPTGFMHIGNLRTAIFEYLVAKGNNGKFILRIEDTDQERKVEGAVKFIYDTLKLCNIKIDEGPENPGEVGPYIQSERKEIYKEDHFRGQSNQKMVAGICAAHRCRIYDRLRYPLP